MSKKGFTLIELMVVITIVAILATVVMVTLRNARDRAEDVTRMSAVSQIRSLAYASAGDDDIDLNDLDSIGGELGQLICKYGSSANPDCESMGILTIVIDDVEKKYCAGIQLLEKDSNEENKYFCIDNRLTAEKYDNSVYNCQAGNPSCL